MQPAFPTAEGFGKYALGGRGGSVYTVTSFADNGPGSLREALTAEGPRTVVFAVSGVIPLERDLVIRNGYVTIAGQTAPGKGITLKNRALVVEADHVIIRHIRARPGDEAGVETDALWVRSGDHVIIDHVSASWGNDETLTVSPNPDNPRSMIGNLTVQWSVISESLNQSVHRKGAHGYGSLVRGTGGSYYSFHHNLWAHHRARMPRPGNYLDRSVDPVGPVMDFSNNVFYNWGQDASGYNADTESVSRYNFVNNHYLRGPDSRGGRAFEESNPYSIPWFAGNTMDREEPDDPWSLVRFKSEHTTRAAAPQPNGGLNAEAAEVAYYRVIARAGASLHRDAVDMRVINDVMNGSGRIIDSASDVGGWPVHEVVKAPPDSDGDGMPDWWESSRGLDPESDADGRLDPDKDGYTNLEDYLNCRADPGCRGRPVQDPYGLAGKTHSAVTPAHRSNVEWWLPRHEQVLRRVAQGNVDLILVGDSITHNWENAGKELWDTYFEPRNAVNLGFSGDRTQHVLWRLDHGEIDGISPRLAVLMIGTNNSNGQDNTAEEIADGIKAICTEMRARLPATKILILAIFPRGDADQRAAKGLDAAFNDQWAKNNRASELASEIADNEFIFYLDINQAFLDEEGVLTREVMPDLLHPQEKGYRIWAEAIEPSVAKLLGEK